MWAQILNIFLGLIVMTLPGMINLSKIASDNNHIAGPLVITFAVVASTEIGRNARWVNVFFGTWLILAPFVLGFSGTARIADILLGCGVTLLSFSKGKIDKQFGGGWISLFQKNPSHIQAAKDLSKDESNN